MTSPSPDQAPDARHRVALVVYPGFTEFEVTVPLTLLARRYEIVTVGLTPEAVRGEARMRVLPDATLDDARHEDFAAVLVPGGVDMQPLSGVSALSDLLVRTLDRGGLVGAICGGPFALGQAGLLDVPYTVTFTPEQRAFLGVFPEEHFAYRDVVRSGNVVTAQGHAFAEFGLVIAETLGAVRNVEGARRFYRGLGNPGMESDTATPSA